MNFGEFTEEVVFYRAMFPIEIHSHSFEHGSGHRYGSSAPSSVQMGLRSLYVGVKPCHSIGGRQSVGPESVTLGKVLNGAGSRFFCNRGRMETDKVMQASDESGVLIFLKESIRFGESQRVGVGRLDVDGCLDPGAQEAPG